MFQQIRIVIVQKRDKVASSAILSYRGEFTQNVRWNERFCMELPAQLLRYARIPVLFVAEQQHVA